jgi:3-phenylpropionate/trans-cinnamate dioxygenase ferredoxin reductase subunit
VLPPVVSEALRALHELHGVTIACAATVSAFEGCSDGRIEAVLSDGTRRSADLAVAGIGMVANDGLARECGLACDRGIVVDASCATSDPHVFAAGDVAVMANELRLESWQNAQDQGIAAARAALGRAVRYQPLPKFWSQQYDTMIQILGLPGSEDDVVLRGDVAGNRFVAFTLRDGRISSGIAFNAPRELRAARTLIESQAQVDPALLADPGTSLAGWSQPCSPASGYHTEA